MTRCSARPWPGPSSSRGRRLPSGQLRAQAGQLGVARIRGAALLDGHGRLVAAAELLVLPGELLLVFLQAAVALLVGVDRLQHPALVLLGVGAAADREPQHVVDGGHCSSSVMSGIWPAASRQGWQTYRS